MRRMPCIERSWVNEGVRDPLNFDDSDDRGLFLQTRQAVTESIHTRKEIFCNGHSTDLQHHRKCSPHP